MKRVLAVTIKREKEKQLQKTLWEMRDAIELQGHRADRGGFQIKADSYGYPPTLDDLVKGVDVQGKRTRFLRMRSMQDDADSDSWGGAGRV